MDRTWQYMSILYRQLSLTSTETISNENQILTRIFEWIRYTHPSNRRINFISQFRLSQLHYTFSYFSFRNWYLNQWHENKISFFPLRSTYACTVQALYTCCSLLHGTWFTPKSTRIGHNTTSSHHIIAAVMLYGSVKVVKEHMELISRIFISWVNLILYQWICGWRVAYLSLCQRWK